MLQVAENMDISHTEIRKAHQGDEKAIAKIYDLVANELYTVCLRYANSPMEAQDFFHDGFLHIISKLSKFNGTGKFKNWARRVLVNFILEEFRKNKKWKYYELDYRYEEDFSYEEELPSTSKEIIHLLQELPEGYRTVFNLYVFEELSHKQIAEKLGISVNTSKTQYHKAKNYLRKLLKKKNYEVA